MALKKKPVTGMKDILPGEMEIREGDELQFAERIYVFLREWTDIRR